MHLALLVPAPFDAVSGGYAYDRRMVAGLRAAGHSVDVIELAGRHPLADDTARLSAAAAWAALPAGAMPIIDGLGLPAFGELADAVDADGVQDVLLGVGDRVFQADGADQPGLGAGGCLPDAALVVDARIQARDEARRP